MTTNHNPQGRTTARSRASKTGGYTARTLHLLTLAVAGDQDVAVHTHHGDTEVNFFAGRHLTLTLATLLIYCHTLDTVTTIAEAWQTARLHAHGLPVDADTAVRHRLRRQTDASAVLTSAATFHQPVGWDVRPVSARTTGDGHAALLVNTGPVTVTVRDQAALLRICEAWETASTAARELWTQPLPRHQDHPLPSPYTARRDRR